MCESEQTIAQLASKHTGHFLKACHPLSLYIGTKCSAKISSRSLSLSACIMNDIKYRWFNLMAVNIIHTYMHTQTAIIITIIGLLCIVVSPLQLMLTGPKTCLGFEVENEGDKLLFTYHHNPNVGTANMLVYDDLGNFMNHTGSGAEHQTYLQVVFPRKGEGEVCFEKSTSNSLEVHFQIIHEEQQTAFSGREDIGKITRRVGEFLVEIKKTSLQYKEVLAQHNARQDRLKDYESKNMIIYVAKVAVMVAILGAQFWAVRKIFE